MSEISADLNQSGAGGAAARIISAPCGTKPDVGDTLDYDVIGDVPFCFYRFRHAPLMDHLRKLCLAAEEEILKLPVADHWEQEQSDQDMRQFGTTARFPYYNMLLLKDTALIHVFRAVQRCYMTMVEQLGLDQAPVWIQCWENVLRRDGHLHKHAHDFFMHGHLTVATPGSRTGYEFDNGEAVEIENEPGLLTLIGRAGVMHYTTPNPIEEPRISMAFDLCLEPQLDNNILDRHTFIPLL